MTPRQPRSKPVADEILLARMARGDRTALVELMARYHTVAFAVAYAILIDPEDAETVVAQAFDGVWRDAEGFDPKRNSVCGGLTSLTRALAQRRLEARRPAV